MSAAEELAKLPEGVLQDCAARASLSTHAPMKIASRNLRTFIETEKVFTVRSFLGLREVCIHIGLQSAYSATTEWYSLQQTSLTHRFMLRRVPFPDFPPTEYDLIDPCGNGNSVFAIGKRTREFLGVTCYGAYATTVFPAMQSVHRNPATAVLGNRVYVFGGCQKSDANYIEVLDLSANNENRQWERVLVEEKEKIIPAGSEVIVKEGKVFFLRKNDCVVFDPAFELWSSKLFRFNGGIMVLHQPWPEQIWFTRIALRKQGMEMVGHVESSDCVLSLSRPLVCLALVEISEVESKWFQICLCSLVKP